MQRVRSREATASHRTIKNFPFASPVGSPRFPCKPGLVHPAPVLQKDWLATLSWFLQHSLLAETSSISHSCIRSNSVINLLSNNSHNGSSFLIKPWLLASIFMGSATRDSTLQGWSDYSLCWAPNLPTTGTSPECQIWYHSPGEPASHLIWTTSIIEEQCFVLLGINAYSEYGFLLCPECFCQNHHLWTCRVSYYSIEHCFRPRNSFCIKVSSTVVCIHRIYWYYHISPSCWSSWPDGTKDSVMGPAGWQYYKVGVILSSIV